MKTTLDIPDPVFRRAKASAALRGISLRQIVTEALEEKLAAATRSESSTPPAWMTGFGELAELGDESRRIDALIRKEFETLEPEDHE